MDPYEKLVWPLTRSRFVKHMVSACLRSFNNLMPLTHNVIFMELCFYVTNQSAVTSIPIKINYGLNYNDYYLQGCMDAYQTVFSLEDIRQEILTEIVRREMLK